MKQQITRFSSTLALAAPTLALLASQAADGAIFIKFDGIDGESNDANHGKWIEILSWSWGASNAGAAGGGTGAGKVSMQDFHFTCAVSKASPKLFLACATGEHIPAVSLVFTRTLADGKPVAYYQVTLSDVLVSSLAGGRDEGTPNRLTDRPVEKVSLNFSKIEFKYLPYDDSGAPGTPEVAEAEVVPATAQ